MGERSKVYMTDLRCRPGVSLLNKLEKLMRTAGIGEINFERKLVAIKMHFGEPGNLAFLRPNYAKVVAQKKRIFLIIFRQLKFCFILRN